MIKPDKHFPVVDYFYKTNSGGHEKKISHSDSIEIKGRLEYFWTVMHDGQG